MTLTLLLCIVIGALIFVAGMHLIDRTAANAVDGVRLSGDCHPAPRGPMTVEAAHAILQDRRDCELRECGEKWAAYWYLVDAGKLLPGREVIR